MEKTPLDAYHKAQAFNMDRGTYGTIAEIGAGQETVRWFFKVGGAAGSIAKSLSAYDMKVSDSIYGACKRYVSRERLHAMLDTEYESLIERLGEARGADSTFFAFANTVATFSYATKRPGHGWLANCNRNNLLYNLLKDSLTGNFINGCKALGINTKAFCSSGRS